jgi:hypothetical protein
VATLGGRDTVGAGDPGDAGADVHAPSASRAVASSGTAGSADLIGMRRP